MRHVCMCLVRQVDLSGNFFTGALPSALFGETRVMEGLGITSII